MHKSCLGAVVIDCRTDDLERAAAFWGAALGYPVRGTDDPRYLELEPAPGQPAVVLQRVEHASRVHLDIETDDVDAEVARLEALGAKRVEQVKSWWVMEAPTGHRFCVIRPQREDFAERGMVRQA
jgi:predicted enzyme related to lactoylglutathione lyase